MVEASLSRTYCNGVILHNCKVQTTPQVHKNIREDGKLISGQFWHFQRNFAVEHDNTWTKLWEILLVLYEICIMLVVGLEQWHWPTLLTGNQEKKLECPTPV